MNGGQPAQQAQPNNGGGGAMPDFMAQLMKAFGAGGKTTGSPAQPQPNPNPQSPQLQPNPTAPSFGAIAMPQPAAAPAMPPGANLLMNAFQQGQQKLATQANSPFPTPPTRPIGGFPSEPTKPAVGGGDSSGPNYRYPSHTFQGRRERGRVGGRDG